VNGGIAELSDRKRRQKANFSAAKNLLFAKEYQLNCACYISKETEKFTLFS
jgi:hypothetical protein